MQFSSAIAANSMMHISGVLHGCTALSSSCPIVVSHARIPHSMSTNPMHDLARQGVFVHSISQCSRTGDAKSSDAVAFGSAGWQANNAKAFHKLGGLNMRGLKKASLSKSKSCPNANDQAVTLFDCAFTSLKVEAHSGIQSKFLSSTSQKLEAYIECDPLNGKNGAIGQSFVSYSSWSQPSSDNPVVLHRTGSAEDATSTLSSE